MKKNLLFIGCLLFAGFAQAQFTAGQKLIGGQLLNVGFTNSNNEKGFGIGIAPSFSRFKSPLLMNTFGLSYTYSHARNGSGVSEINYHANRAGIFFERTRLKMLAKNFYFTYTIRPALYLTTDKTTSAINTNYTTSKSYGANLSAGLGVLYQLNQRFLLQCGLTNVVNLYYSHSDYSANSAPGVNNKSFNNSFGLDTGLSGIQLNSLGIGVKYLLRN